MIALAAGLIGLGVMHTVMFAYGIMTSYHMSFGYAPLVAFVIFCCARYRNAIADALGSRPMVIGGDASYSIYLLHVIAVRATILQFAVSVTFGPRDILWIAGTLALLMAMALVSYYFWERPARRLLRRLALQPAPRVQGESASRL
jgi:peptidoglycan/LPS O-acetylase OafA/YrhL